MLPLLAALLLAQPITSTAPVVIQNVRLVLDAGVPVTNSTDGGALLNVYVVGSSSGALSNTELRAAPLSVELADAGVWVKNFPAASGSWFPDGGSLGLVNAQLVDSGVSITNFPVQNGSWYPDGGSLGLVNAQLVDSGVSVTNFPVQNGSWYPDGGYLGFVNSVLVDSGVAVTNFPVQNGSWYPDGGSLGLVNAQLVDSGVSVTNFPVQNGSWYPDGGYLGFVNAQLVDSGVAITNWPLTQPVSVASVPAHQVSALGPDGGATFDVSGSSVVIAAPVYVFVASPPLNPFLPRCNKVRTRGCQP